MKKIFLAAGIIMMAVTTSFAHNNVGPGNSKESKMEKKEERKERREIRRAARHNLVSDFTIKQFAVDFPDVANPEFLKTPNFDEVVFMSGNTKLRAYYDNESKLVGTIKKVNFTDLPANAQSNINKRYGDYSIDRTIMFDDNEHNETDMVLFGNPFDDVDNYFVELEKGNKDIVLKVDMQGEVSFFKQIY